MCPLSSQVTVYRMICSNTVEEKIVKRASQKSTVQQLVMTGQQAQADVFQPEEVMSLLLDDAELEQQMKAQAAKQPVSGVSLSFWSYGRCYPDLMVVVNWYEVVVAEVAASGG